MNFLYIFSHIDKQTLYCYNFFKIYPILKKYILFLSCNVIQMKRDEIIFNRFIKFFPDGCFHDLLLYWYSLMVKVQEQGYTFDFSSDPNPYKSYLPKEKFDQYLSTGFQLVKEQAFEEYIEIVFSTFFAEVIQEYPNQLCIAEILLLKKIADLFGTAGYGNLYYCYGCICLTASQYQNHYCPRKSE